MFRIMLGLVLSAILACGGMTAPTAAQERKNINTLTATELEGLRRGVAVMKARDAAARNTVNWRRSWTFWANMHGYFGAGCTETTMPAAGMQGVRTWGPANAQERDTWCTCQHRSDAFITWHRIAVYQFERVLQEAAGMPQLRLPFWDLTAQPALPAAFRSPTYVNTQGQTVANPLYAPNRPAALNNGTAVISASARSTTNAMAATTLSTFRQRLESTPHGAVHCALGAAGCPSGLMAHLSSAALDPIFWLHHANIDRLYECWLSGGPNRLPAGAQLDRTFRFPDRDGAIVAIRVRDRLTTAQMGYRYASGSSCAATAELAPEPAFEPVEAQLWQAQAQGRPRATLPAAAAQRGRRPVLRLEDVVPDPVDPGMYDVYVVAPDGRRALVGNMNFFGTSEQGGHAGHGARQGQGQNFDFDLARAVRGLGLHPGSDFELAFERTTGLEPAVPGVQAAEAVAPLPQRGGPLRIGRIGVAVE